jgi:Mor family transcriptional regulator
MQRRIPQEPEDKNQKVFLVQSDDHEEGIRTLVERILKEEVDCLYAEIERQGYENKVTAEAFTAGVYTGMVVMTRKVAKGKVTIRNLALEEGGDE